MPWLEKDKVDLRLSLVKRYLRGENISELCRQYQISRPTAYLWIKRYESSGRLEALYDKSSKPQESPNKTEQHREAAVVRIREEYGWGARKVQEILRQEGIILSESTIKRIFNRNNLISQRERHRPALKRFEKESPNQLWQADFKGPMGRRGMVCEPLSILDDHSRFVVGLHPVVSKHLEVVKEAFKKTFISCGIPDSLLVDHGTPWWGTTNRNGFSQLAVWIMNQDITLTYSGYNHPQTQGKVERFHRTLDDAVHHKGLPSSITIWPKLLETIQDEYNFKRPHEALGMKVPATRYIKSHRQFLDKESRPEYSKGALVQKIDAHGSVRVGGKRFFVSESLKHQYVQLDQLEDSILVKFRKTNVRELNLKTCTSYPLPVSYSQL